jgi:16S rRNA (cytosine1402-N4)-methyltransferase
MENENQTPHKRRVHYKGKYPKKFEEKYKELQPEKYKDTIAHVIQKGNTPAGMHISIMVKEILDFLQIKPGQTGFDATLGYGGHTKAMLEQLQGQGHIHATDVDPVESAKTKKRLAEQGFGEDILTVHLQNFCTIDEIAKEVGGFDFILADLGVSSMQIDNPERGFSFKVDGPLDLRLNQEAGISAAERLDTISRDELAGMLYENSDEPHCEELAKAPMRSAKDTAWIPPQNCAGLLKTLSIFCRKRIKKKPSKRPVSGRFRHFALMSTASLRCSMNLWKNCRVL